MNTASFRWPKASLYHLGIAMGWIDAEALIIWLPAAKGWLTGKDLDAGKTDGKRRRRQQYLRWLDSITDSMVMNLSKLRETVKGRGAWLAAVHRVAKSQTWLSNYTTTTGAEFSRILTILKSLSRLSYLQSTSWEMLGWMTQAGIKTGRRNNTLRYERVTGRKARGLHTEEIGCKRQTFLSLLSRRRKQTRDFFFFPSVYKFKRRFLLKYCVAIMTPGFTWS